MSCFKTEEWNFNFFKKGREQAPLHSWGDKHWWQTPPGPLKGL